MIGSSSRFCIFGALFLLVGCGGTQDRPAGRTLSGAALDEWAGGAPATEPAARAEPARSGRAAIELAGGDRLEAFIALVVFEGGGAPVCAVYALRSTDAGLEEGRRTIPCPEQGLAAVRAADIRYRAIDDPRRAELTAALAGARVEPTDGDPTAAIERIAVRVVTDRRTVEGSASPASWPPVDDAPEPSYAHAPRNLSEVYEAVMYPGRFRR